MHASQTTVQKVQANIKATMQTSDHMLAQVTEQLEQLQERQSQLQASIKQLIGENAALKQMVERALQYQAENEQLRAQLAFMVDSIDYAAQYSVVELQDMIKQAQGDLECDASRNSLFANGNQLNQQAAIGMRKNTTGKDEPMIAQNQCGYPLFSQPEVRQATSQSTMHKEPGRYNAGSQ